MKTPTKTKRRDLIKLGILLLIIIVTIAFLYKPLTSLVKEENRQALKGDIEDIGPLAHVMYIGVVAVQVVLTFIPIGATMPLLGGFLFGPILGTIYTLIGVTLGSALAFYLGRKFGRPILEDYISPQTLKIFDEQTEEKGLVTLLFIFLIPFTPDNAICLVAGTTKMRIRSMVAVVAIGKFPGILAGAMIGAGLGSAFTPSIIITLTVIVLILGLAYAKRKEIEEYVKKLI